MFFPIVTERLSLSPLQLSDLESFVRYRQDPEIARYQSWEPTYSMAQGTELISSQQDFNFPPAGEWLQIGIRLSTNGELVGDLALHATQRPGEFEIGFSVASEHQGQGYAYEAAKALLDKLFQERDVASVMAYTDERNSPSIALLRKLGFTADSTKSWIEDFKGETASVRVYGLGQDRA